VIDVSLKNDPSAECQAMIARFKEFPRHLARKHVQASMRRAIKDGIPVMRSVTPPVGVRRGRRRSGQRRSTGALRRSVTTKAKYIAKPTHGAVYGVVGYKGGMESRKAIWLQYGTRRGLASRQMLEQFHQQYDNVSLAKLTTELAAGIEKAAAELAAGKNPGRP
jgi:hypothetical protein